MVRWLKMVRCGWSATGDKTSHGHAIPACRWSRARMMSILASFPLPKGTKFDIKILKSTVSTTSGGDNVWSAVRYVSTLNTSTSHGFGEFTDNLIPNGNFDEGQVKWTPAEAIKELSITQSGKNALSLGGNSDITSCSSDVFIIPPGQTLRFSGYLLTHHPPIEGGVEMKIVTPQQQNTV